MQAIRRLCYTQHRQTLNEEHTMAIQQKLYTVDDVWQLSHRPENEGKRFYLIDGELFVTMSPGIMHGRAANKLGRFLDEFVEEHSRGYVTVEAGFHPAGERHNLLMPDVAFFSLSRLPDPNTERFGPAMPDLAVEVQSPGNSLDELRRKAAVYLNKGASLVWIVRTRQRGVDVCRAGAGGGLNIEFVGRDGSLSGEDVLPGFELELTRLFPDD